MKHHGSEGVLARARTTIEITLPQTGEVRYNKVSGHRSNRSEEPNDLLKFTGRQRGGLGNGMRRSLNKSFLKMLDIRSIKGRLVLLSSLH